LRFEGFVYIGKIFFLSLCFFLRSNDNSYIWLGVSFDLSLIIRLSSLSNSGKQLNFIQYYKAPTLQLSAEALCIPASTSGAIKEFPFLHLEIFSFIDFVGKGGNLITALPLLIKIYSFVRNLYWPDH
jgi:hypothetical protein